MVTPSMGGLPRRAREVVKRHCRLRHVLYRHLVAVLSTSICCLCTCADDDAAGEEPSECVGELRLQHVSFCYPARRDVMVMKDFCLDVKAGE